MAISKRHRKSRGRKSRGRKTRSSSRKHYRRGRGVAIIPVRDFENSLTIGNYYIFNGEYRNNTIPLFCGKLIKLENNSVTVINYTNLNPNQGSTENVSSTEEFIMPMEWLTSAVFMGNSCTPASNYTINTRR